MYFITSSSASRWTGFHARMVKMFHSIFPMQDLSEWACIYIRYIQILKKLETAYDQMVHPQKRLDMRKALEACIGRTIEIRHWMVKLNRGLDFVSLDDILVDLKLTPEVLEIAVPKYFIEDRAKELDDRDKFLEALVEKYNVKPAQPNPIIKIGAPLGEEEAIMLIQRNERGMFSIFIFMTVW